METCSAISSTSRNRVSVALCTYNGAAFLPRQLASIENQTRLPDEVIICDDRSNDGTVDIVRKFAASVPFAVKIILNRENLGSTKNFEQAIRACTGDLIALSDQDDIWYPTRLERSEQELLTHPEVGLVFSDANIVDDQDRPVGATLWQAFSFTKKKEQQLLDGDYNLCVKYRFVTGATAMFRASMRDHCLPIGTGWLHDEWLAATVAIFGDLRPIDSPLVFYRNHTAQQIGPTRQLSSRDVTNERWNMFSSGKEAKKHWDQLAKESRILQTLCDALSELPLSEVGRTRLRGYWAYLQFVSFRSNLSRRRLGRVYPVLKSRSDYSKHFNGWISMAKDLLLIRS
jgi:glycosyltransferase involved in cell wall biosynthesis